jgi:LPS-assembly protein
LNPTLQPVAGPPRSVRRAVIRRRKSIGGNRVSVQGNGPAALISFRNIINYFCTENNASLEILRRVAPPLVIVLTFLTGNVSAQDARPSFLSAPSPPPSTAAPGALKPIRPHAPPPGYYRVSARVEEKDGSEYHLRGDAEIETAEWVLRADRIDYNDETGDASAAGSVEFESFANGEKLYASSAEYNTHSETGKFYDVRGSSPAKIDARPGLLTTSNPFYFAGRWAEKLEDRYVLHDGFITDCAMPSPWWILKGSRFDIIPGDRALAYHSWVRVRKIPILYAPVFYRSLKRYPRKSGFLMPNMGNSSRRGKMIGVGYYWAINRSYDLTYRNQYFTQRGFAHNFDFRGKVNRRTDFNMVLYGVNDRGVKIGDTVQKQGGYLLSFAGRSELGGGWSARADMNYLSSFVFRQNFTESFNEAIQSETRSTAVLTKHWSSYGANVVFDRDEVFQFARLLDKVATRKLPEGEFIVREREIARKALPVWFSMTSSAGLLKREEDLEQQPLWSTAGFVDRVDLAPRVTTAFRWKDFSLTPSFTLRETHYGSTYGPTGQPSGSNLWRSAREVRVEIGLPSFSRIFDSPRWLGGDQVKHTIEPHAFYRNISGIGDAFNDLIPFDSTELWANTNEIEYGITNRLYTKTKGGQVSEVLTWDLAQRHYFDPTFGGALTPGRRNVIISSADLTGYAFLDQPRSWSPIVSTLRYARQIALEWRSDYDPLRGHIVSSLLNASWRKDRYWFSLGHNQLRNNPVLATSSNQFTGTIGWGADNRRGLSAAFSGYYDYRQRRLQYAQAQVTYNTDCCGFSVQYRRFNFGTRNENQFLVAFAVANIGSFGTLKRQERLF